MSTSNEEEVLYIAKKLDKMVSKKSADNALDVLKALKQIPINLDTLQKTRIGMSVNNIRKQTANDEVAIAAKQLIKGWKKLVSEPSSASKKSEDNKKKEKPEPIISTNIRKTSTTKMEVSASSHTMDTSSLQSTGNSVRDKCREMLVRGLQTDNTSGHSDQQCAFLAAAIEEAIYSEFKDTGVKYKNRIRSRFSNLKDTRNSILRLNVLNGILKPEQIAKMTAEEMASDEMKKKREEYEQQNIKDHQMSVNEGTKTDMFVCGRCKGRACTYNQLQTRSADEPMTTFVFCTECGNRWKFC
uniref:Transcription elongation factor n=1 Tax=Ciona intestinalis TaxID=7719 RepID=F6XTV8_CIOIN|nr:transcription elongation factor A protein 1 [Ciona intestinalis]|eukprot:XP_002120544.1 transcription elongation factor A protein 1 [Ciona intestinalis]